MAVALRIVCLLSVLLLAGCFKTELPRSYGYSGHAYGTVRSDGTYTVRRGDTLFSVGKRFGVDYKLLARRNRIRYPYTIYVGQHLYLTRTAPRSQYLPLPKHPPAAKTVKRKPPSTAGKQAARKPVSSGKARTSPPRLRWPTSGTVTSRFGRRGSRMHDGIDIGTKEGTPVYAAAGGEVVYSDQRLSGYGKLIIIRHGGDMFTAYAHNQRNLVRKGMKVNAGDMIARVGRTGRASGSHLHFEVRRGSTPVDPLSYLPRKR